MTAFRGDDGGVRDPAEDRLDENEGEVMHQIRKRVTVSESGEIVITVPPDFPRGEAEIVVVAAEPTGLEAVAEFDRWLEEWRASLPPAPSLPLSAFDRGEVYR